MEAHLPIKLLYAQLKHLGGVSEEPVLENGRGCLIILQIRLTVTDSDHFVFDKRSL